MRLTVTGIWLGIALLVFFLPIGAQDKQLPVLQYVDGHGNSYEFLQDGSDYMLDFVPVKKTTKSSSYSGGEPAQRRVSKETFQKLSDRIDKAIKKKLGHERERGTALIIKLLKGDLKEYVLPKGSSEIKDIEALLFAMF